MPRPTIAVWILLFFCAPPSSIQAQSAAPAIDEHKPIPPDQVRLPNGKLQQDEILRVDHDRELQDVGRLVELAQALQKDIEQSGAHVLSISSIHRTEEIEKLAKRIRSRMRGY